MERLTFQTGGIFTLPDGSKEKHVAIWGSGGDKTKHHVVTMPVYNNESRQDDIATRQQLREHLERDDIHWW